MTWRPDPEPIAEQELDRFELAEYYRQRDRQPRANRTPHHREAGPDWEVRCFSCAELHDPGDGCPHLDLCATCAGECRLCAEDDCCDPWGETP